MAVGMTEKKVSTLVLVVIVGMLIGSYLNALVGMIPGGDNVIKTLFTFNLTPFAIGYPNPVDIDFDALRFQFGFQMKISALTILGIFMSLYFFRWYR